jgi:hypothetical protein
MNALNVSKAIAVMERVKERGDSFSMRQWQFPREELGRACTSEDDLHECGMPACFGGWIAVSPEFIEDGGSAARISGAPVLGSGDRGDASIGAWLGINEEDSANLCGFFETAMYGGKTIGDVGVDDVLNVLYRLRDTGSVW